MNAAELLRYTTPEALALFERTHEATFGRNARFPPQDGRAEFYVVERLRGRAPK